MEGTVLFPRTSGHILGHDGNHQGKENLLLFPATDQLPQSERKLRSRERLGRLLRFYHLEAHKYFDLTGSGHRRIGIPRSRF